MNPRERFIIDLLKNIDGIGPTTIENIKQSNNLSSYTIGDNIRDLDEEYIMSLENELNQYDFLDQDVRLSHSEFIIDRFLERQYKKIRSITLEDIEDKVNLLLVNSLGLEKARDVIEFYVYQIVNRSSTTSWGTTVENLCLIAGAQEYTEDEFETGKNPDVKKELNGDTYYIQIKSGPNTMNVGMVSSLNNVFETVESEYDGTAMLGMTYGEKHQVSSQIRNNLDNFSKRVKIGDEFWEFLSQSEDYFDELIGVTSDVLNDFDISYIDLIELKIEELVDDWKNKYGTDSIDELL